MKLGVCAWSLGYDPNKKPHTDLNLGPVIYLVLPHPSNSGVRGVS